MARVNVLQDEGSKGPGKKARSGIPAVSEQDIRSRVGEASLSRGRPYARRGAVFDTRRQGMTLKARCQGTMPQPYRVQVTFAEKGIAHADCSCPVGAGGYCKHVAALLLTWLERPDAFVEVEDIDAALEKRSKAELITLIKLMLRREPDLEVLLEAPLPAGQRSGPVDPEAYRRQAEAVFRQAGYDSGYDSDYDWGSVVEIAEGLRSILEIGDGFAEQQDFANALAVYTAVASTVVQHSTDYQDEEGDLHEVIGECVDGLGRCLAGVSDDGTTREAILRALFEIYRFDVDLGGVGLADDVPDLILEHATPEERRTVATWVRESLPQGTGWGAGFQRDCFGGFLLDLEGPDLDDEAFLQTCRDTGRVGDLVDRLLRLGRLEEAISAAERTEDYTLLVLADLFVRHGHGPIAERLIGRRSEQTQDIRLLACLRDWYKAQGDPAAALEQAKRIFRLRPDFEGYRGIRRLAQRVGRWEDLRQELLDYLRKSHHTYVLIEILLDEGDIDQALAIVKTEPVYGYGAALSVNPKLQVAAAAEEPRPRAALEIYREQAEQLINLRNRRAYQDACSYLIKVRQLYDRLGEEEGWTSYITDLRARYRTFRALMEELASVGL